MIPHPPRTLDALRPRSLNGYCGRPVAKPDFRHNGLRLRRTGHGTRDTGHGVGRTPPAASRRSLSRRCQSFARQKKPVAVRALLEKSHPLRGLTAQKPVFAAGPATPVFLGQRGRTRVRPISGEPTGRRRVKRARAERVPSTGRRLVVGPPWRLQLSCDPSATAANKERGPPSVVRICSSFCRGGNRCRALRP